MNRVVLDSRLEPSKCLFKMFPCAISLEVFFERVLPTLKQHIASQSDIVNLLKDVYVIDAENIVYAQAWKDAVNTRNVSIIEVIERLVAPIVRSSSSNSNQNILSYGYRLKAAHSKAGVRNSLELECQFVNTTHSVFMTAQWKALARILGTYFCLLLSDTGNNGCCACFR